MQAKAEKRYRQVYATEFRKTGDSQQLHRQHWLTSKHHLEPILTRECMLSILKLAGIMLVSLSMEQLLGKPINLSTAVTEVGVKIAKSDEKTVLSQPEMYTGETDQLKEMLSGMTSTGSVKVPEALYSIQRRSGGNMSMRQLLNTRLKANGLDEIPKEMGRMLDGVESSFDTRYNKYLNYMPRPVRTDIAAIGSGQEAVYTQAQPAQRRALDAIASKESGAAGYDAVNQMGVEAELRLLVIVVHLVVCHNIVARN